MAGNGHGEHFQNVGRGGVHQHSHKFQAHHNGQQVVQHVIDIGKIRFVGEHVENFNSQCTQQGNDGNTRNDLLHNPQNSAENMFHSAVMLGSFLKMGLNFGVIGCGDVTHGQRLLRI